MHGVVVARGAAVNAARARGSHGESCLPLGTSFDSLSLHMDGHDARASMHALSAQSIIDALAAHVTPRRLDRMRTVLAQRTRWITVAVEDIYQPHNASAVLRSCDAFGVQAVHIIENRNRWRVNPGVELGSAQWLSITRHTGPDARSDHSAAPTDPWPPATEATQTCFEHLRADGYRIIATTPHSDASTPATLDLSAGPVALVFGTEKEGLTPWALDHADGHLAIPMVGFVESLNISVSAAVTLATLTERLRATAAGIDWRLDTTEQTELLARWLIGSVRRAEVILERAQSTGPPH